MTDRPSGPAAPRIAILGGGIAGLACGARLAGAGARVVVFDKGRSPGGRMATRRRDVWQFDHGAQYFTARDPEFVAEVARWQAAGVAAAWAGRTVTLGGPAPDEPARQRFVGVPAMTALGRHLATAVDVSVGVRIAAVDRDGATWSLRREDGAVAEGFDRLVIAVPAPQATGFLSAAPALAAAAAEARYAPCLTMMLAFAAPLAVGFDAAFVAAGPLGWIAHDGGKPGRGGAATWVAHATSAWSLAHLDDPPEDVQRALTAAFAEAVGRPGLEPASAVVHRWRYALVTRAVGAPCLYDPVQGLGACGDWCLGGRIEAAWLSGVAMADRLIREKAGAVP